MAGPSGEVPPRAAQAGGCQGPALSLHGPSRRVGDPSANDSFNWKKGKEGRDLLLTHCGSSAHVLLARSGPRVLPRSRRDWEVYLWGDGNSLATTLPLNDVAVRKASIMLQ